MKADHVDVAAVDPVGVEEGLDRLGMQRRSRAARPRRARPAARRAHAARRRLHRAPRSTPSLVLVIGMIARSARSARSRSPSVSISATSTPSIEVPLISPIAAHAACALILGLNPWPDLLHHRPPQRADPKPSSPMSDFKSDFLHVLSRARLHPPDLRRRRPRRARGEARRVAAYVGFDCTAPSLHVGYLLSIMMLHWLQQTGHKPIALMGGGTTRVGDPSGKDESRKHPHRRADRRQQGVDQGRSFAKFLDFGDGQERRRHGRQRRLADQAQLHRVPARRRPAFLGQPHADLRLGEAAARARAGAVVPRIQLHDPAGLRLRRARTGATAACCRWAARTSGATSSTASTSAAAWARTSSSR